MIDGGDNCSRSVHLGAVLGAALGVGGVPCQWKHRVTAWSEIERAIDSIVQMHATCTPFEVAFSVTA